MSGLFAGGWKKLVSAHRKGVRTKLTAVKDFPEAVHSYANRTELAPCITGIKWFLVVMLYTVGDKPTELGFWRGGA